jgi:photosystem II stability/assembly factor-like uncharacterized protein
MKKKFLLIGFFVIAIVGVYAQPDVWTIQSPLPTGNGLNSIYFHNADTGFILGNGYSYRTDNGGNTWTEIKGVGGQSVYFVGNTGYAVAEGTHIQKTIDGGKTWTNHATGIYCILNSVFFTDANSGYVVGGNGTILKTIDGGITWTMKMINPFNTFSSVYFTDANTGYAADFNGKIVKTVNAGTTWATIYTSSTVSFSSIYFINSNIGYAVGSAILKTVDGGATWTTQASGMSLQEVYFTDANTGYVVGNGRKILKTIDGGATWIAQVCGTADYYLNSVCFIGNTGYIVGENGTLLKTINGGATWSSIINGTTSALNSVNFTDANTGYAVGFNGTILKTINGGSVWANKISGTIRSLNSVCFIGNTGYTVGDSGITLKTINGGSNWISQTSSTICDLHSVFFINDMTGFAAGDSGKIIKTVNGGTTWTSLNSSTTNRLYSVYFTDINTGYAVGQSGTILKTIDGGSNWTPQTSGSTKLLYSVFFVNADTGYIVGGGGTILETNNGGFTWINKPSGTQADLYSIYFKGKTGYIVGYYWDVSLWTPSYLVVLKTINGGIDWTPTIKPIGINWDLRSVYFTDSITGYAVGSGGTIIKTTTGGDLPNLYFKTQPANKFVSKDSSVTFKIIARGVTPISYQWYKDGTKINGATDSILEMTNLQYSDSGNYQCSIKNSFDSLISEKGKLTVLAFNPMPPVIVRQPKSITLAVWDTVAFSVSVTGYAPLTFEWYLILNPLLIASDSVVRWKAVLSDDKKMYYCKISNQIGTVYSDTVTLNVIANPKSPLIIKQPESITVKEGDTAVFSVSSSGFAPITYQWFKIGTSLPVASDSVLSWKATLSDNNKMYYCKISNMVGFVYSDTVTLKVIAKIGFKENGNENLKIYPNPATELITIETTCDGPVEIQLVNMQGIEILNRKGETNSGQIQLLLPKGMNKGVYCLVVKCRENVVSKNIIIE